jgi:hypothetical protein
MGGGRTDESRISEMSIEDGRSGKAKDPNERYYEKAIRSLRDLFERARAAHELHFAMALMPEFRGEQDAGWSTAEEAVRAYDQFAALVKTLNRNDEIRVRIILAFYATSRRGADFTRYLRSYCSRSRGAEIISGRSRALRNDIGKRAK